MEGRRVRDWKTEEFALSRPYKNASYAAVNETLAPLVEEIRVLIGTNVLIDMYVKIPW